jgi:hypothetical protein
MLLYILKGKDIKNRKKCRDYPAGCRNLSVGVEEGAVRGTNLLYITQWRCRGVKTQLFCKALHPIVQTDLRQVLTWTI